MSQAIIVAGQSNALGYLNDGPAPYNPVASVVIWQTDHWEEMQPGVNTGTAANPHAWGPEVGYALAWQRDHGDETLYVVKDVKGETSLAQHDGFDWSPESRGELYDATAAQVAASHIGNATVLWAQGEQDATNVDDARAYADNLADLKQHAAQDWGAVQFVVAQSSSAYAYNDMVAAAQWGGIVTHDFSKVDGLHYDAAGQLQLGDAFYDHWQIAAGF